jgi:2-methylcitrate dehydratase PrpD
VRFVLSYAAQQASGIPFWQRDPEHIEKAFDFGGMGARNGVSAASMVNAGFSAVEDCLSGRHNLLVAFAEAPNADRLVAGLGEDFEILRASIKKWCVGSPIQAALDSLEFLMGEYALRADQVRKLTVHMPDDRLHVVDNRTMPDICLQHLLAVMLIDGGLTFESSHDYNRMSDPEVVELRKRIEAVPSAELTHATPARQAIVEITTAAGERLTRRTYCVRGTPDNPMDQAEVEAKALDLLTPILGRGRSQDVIAVVSRLEELDSIADLSRLLGR